MSLTIWNLTVLMLFCRAHSTCSVSLQGSACSVSLQRSSHLYVGSSCRFHLGGLGQGDVSAVGGELDFVAIVRKVVHILLKQVLAACIR